MKTKALAALLGVARGTGKTATRFYFEKGRRMARLREAAAALKRERKAKARLVAVYQQHMGDVRAAERFHFSRTFYFASTQHTVTVSTTHPPAWRITLGPVSKRRRKP